MRKNQREKKLMPKTGDVVLYCAFGRTLNAIVLDARLGEVSHHGRNGEPVLDLAFIDPERESAIEKKQIGWKPRVFVEYDVVHHSHQFSKEFLTLKRVTTAAQIAALRGQGEWRENGEAELWREKYLSILNDALAFRALPKSPPEPAGVIADSAPDSAPQE